MKVSKVVLERVFDAFQSSQDISMAGGVYLDPDTNLHVLNSFDLPLWQWSLEKNGFDKLSLHNPRSVDYTLLSKSRATKPLSLTADAESRVLAIRNRMHIIRQVILRNEHFTASALPSRDRHTLLEVRGRRG
jgi:DNA polymerase epsilon subunit 2